MNGHPGHEGHAIRLLIQEHSRGGRDDNCVKRIERIKLYPTLRQAQRLQFALDVCRDIYNAALQQRRDAWRSRRLSISHKQQYAQLTELRRCDARVGAVYRELLDAALHKLDLAFAAFFRRLNGNESPGYPRFRSRVRYATLEYSHGDRALKFNAAQNKLKVPKIGCVRVRKGRSVPKYGRAMIVRSSRGWYACLECERGVVPRAFGGHSVGLDVGVAVYCATSDGELVSHPGFVKARRLKMERVQRRISRRKRGGLRRHKAARLFARAMERLRWARRDFQHKLARRIVNAYDFIGVEDLALGNMTRSARGSIETPGHNVKQKSALNRAILDGAWAQFVAILASKAAEAAKQVVAVNPKHTSTTCSACGCIDAASRTTRDRFACTECGYIAHADVNAAKNILRKAQLEPAGRGAGVPDLIDPRSVLTPARNRGAQPEAA